MKVDLKPVLDRVRILKIAITAASIYTEAFVWCNIYRRMLSYVYDGKA